MDASCITTPFGRRAMTLASLANHKQAEKTAPEVKRNKWKLFRTICEAREDLNVSDRSLTVLDALLSFYPSDELSVSNGLIVFPSNAQLSIRARGMTAATLRRHLAALVDAGLILRKDSPNGKRYARRSRSGDISEAYGFSLAPLLFRAKEIEEIAGQISAERELFHIAREKISLCRREITKLMATAHDTEIEGDWPDLDDRFKSLLVGLPRRPSLEELQSVLLRLTELRMRIVNLLENHYNVQKKCANESQNERHIKDSNTHSLSESETKQEALDAAHLIIPTDLQPLTINQQPTKIPTQPVFSSKPDVHLDTVLRACSEIHPYGPGGSIRTWRDLLIATAVLRPMLQITTSVFREACVVMGPENASAAIACIFEKGENINSAGAYLRNLSRRAAQRQFSIRPMVSALLRSKANAS